MENRISIYLTEGECEEKRINTLKQKPALFAPGRTGKFKRIIADNYIAICTFAILIMVYSLFMEQTYVSDMMKIYGKGKSEFGESLSAFSPDFLAYFKMGRSFLFFRYLVEYLLYHVGIDLTHGQFIIQLLGIIPLSLGTAELYNVFTAELGDDHKLAIYISLLLIVINPAFAEILCFTCFHYCWGFYLITIAIRLFFKKKYYLAALVNFFSLCCYQSFYSVFLVVVIAVLFIKETGRPDQKTIRSIFSAFIIEAAAVAASILLTTVLVRIYGLNNSRAVNAVSLQVLWERIQWIIPRYGLNVLTGGGVLPIGLLMGVMFVSALIILRITTKRYGAKGLLFSLGLMTVFALLPATFTIVEETPYIPPRTLTSLYSAAGLLLLGAFIFIKENNDADTFASDVMKAVSCVYFIIMVISVNNYISDIHTANALEANTARQVQIEIDQYQSETGIEVEKICTVHYRYVGQAVFDKTNFDFYGPYYYANHLLLSSYRSDVESVNYFNEKDYEQVYMTEEQFKKYFGSFDLSTLGTFDPHTQLRFDGDTMYWVLY